jgi:hypothetical protein
MPTPGGKNPNVQRWKARMRMARRAHYVLFGVERSEARGRGMSRIRIALSYANVLATVALFIALGGSRTSGC